MKKIWGSIVHILIAILAIIQRIVIVTIIKSKMSNFQRICFHITFIF